MTRRCVLAAAAAALAVGGCTVAPQGACLAGLTSCGGTCVDVRTDDGSCGACGHACGAGTVCQEGVCNLVCAPLATCGSGADARCVDVSSAHDSCGACGKACADAEVCTLGVCHVGCDGQGWARCGSACLDTRDDPANCGGCGIACGEGLACDQGTCVPAAGRPAPRLLVSLTADDTFDDQFTTMARILEAHGARGTFYVNAGRIDIPDRGYLSTPQLQELQSLGHEIGSHGLTHQHLEVVETPPDRIRRELCDSRVDLLARGFAVRSFAYPFGTNDTFAISTAQACGYTSARDVGTVQASEGIYFETVPPQDPWQLHALSSVSSVDTLEEVEQHVLDAEARAPAGAPAWLVINFHHLCPGATCNPALAWDPDLFDQLVGWLAARRGQGTVLRTVSQVASGPLQPAVPSDTPLVINGDFESRLGGADALPDCWMQVASGTSQGAWSRVAGRTGFAEQLVMSEFSVGASRSLMQHRGTAAGPDYKSCGTPVIPGHAYTFSCWYRSDVPVAFAMYRNDDVTHAARSWMVTAASPPSPDGWSLKTYQATIPQSFNTVFFGPFVSSVCTDGCLTAPGTATLVVDDCTVVDED